MSCVSATNCAAVGEYYANGSNTRVPLIEEWNGVNWALVLSPNSVPIDSISAVSCVAAIKCTAVGSFLSSQGGIDYSLVLLRG